MGDPASGPAVRVIGRYALFAQIASGGMAAVHLGRLLGQAGFSRTVAIKRLHPHLAEDPEFVSMLLDEAHLAARIRHPNVVSTLDISATDHELLVVMEYVHGESLSRLLSKLRKEGSHVPPAIASALITGVLYGLHAAHEAKKEDGTPLNIIHRDISPQNVMVGADGIARVVDFGVAKAAGRLQETREGQLKGKIRYMAPEQLKRGELDRAADIYAASVVLWESLTGRRLFDDDNEWRIAQAIVDGAKDPPSRYAPYVPKSLDAIVMRGLAPDRSKRFATAFEMAVAIEDAVPPATPRQVSSWLERVASDALAARASKLAEIEGQSKDIAAAEVEIVSSPSNSSGSWPRSSSRASQADLHGQTSATDASSLTTAQWERATQRASSSALEASEPSRTAAGTANSLLPDLPTRKAGTRPALLGLGAAVVVFALGLVIYAVAAPGKQPASASTPKPISVETAARSVPVANPAVLIPAPPAPSATAAPANDDLTGAAPAASAKKPTPGKKTPSGPGPGSGKVSPKPAAKCDPPYFFDTDGVKHFKPECL